jgi:hypothetical protein
MGRSRLSQPLIPAGARGSGGDRRIGPRWAFLRETSVRRGWGGGPVDREVGRHVQALDDPSVRFGGAFVSRSSLFPCHRGRHGLVHIVLGKGAMASHLSLRALSLLLLTGGLALAGCAPSAADDLASEDDALTTVSADQEDAAQATDISELSFEKLTPTSTKIMKAARWWMKEQDKESRYPKPRMCASNVSKVLFLSGLTAIDQEGVRLLIDNVKTVGGRVLKLPQNKAAFATQLQSFANGALPAGTIVAGMNVKTSAPGDQHIGFVGHTDPDGTVFIYHNNWYRPANEGGARKPFMVSDANLKRGFERQWMATPWIKITRDASGTITKVDSLLPAIDDMDPFNAAFQVTIALLPEIDRELAK